MDKSFNVAVEQSRREVRKRLKTIGLYWVVQGEWHQCEVSVGDRVVKHLLSMGWEKCRCYVCLLRFVWQQWAVRKLSLWKRLWLSELASYKTVRDVVWTIGGTSYFLKKKECCDGYLDQVTADESLYGSNRGVVERNLVKDELGTQGRSIPIRQAFAWTSINVQAGQVVQWDGWQIETFSRDT